MALGSKFASLIPEEEKKRELRRNIDDGLVSNNYSQSVGSGSLLGFWDENIFEQQTAIMSLI